MSITVDNVSKYYGKQKALNNISFSLRKGEICGFLGPNGAGKSTMMKIITGYLTDFTGDVRVNDTDIRRSPLKAKALIGYLPEHNPLYPEMYIGEYLRYVARLYRMKKPAERTEEIIRLTGLKPEEGKKIGQLSKGYRQRVGLAQALIHDPDILILDEPMTGLDPNQLDEIRNLITEIGKNKTVMLSTHVMQEVKAICNRILIINQGNLVTDKYKDELNTTRQGGLLIDIRFATGTDTDWLHTVEDIHCRQLAPGYFRIETLTEKDPRVELFYLAAKHQAPIIELKTEEKKLEDIFREMTATS